MKSSLMDFIRYRKDSMTGEERNAFEREFQKDPFAEEAAEGFASISSEEASEDISEIKKHLKTRIGRRSRFMVYRLAASVAVLMVISTVFLLNVRNRPTKQLTEAVARIEVLERTENQLLTSPSVKDKETEKPAMISEKKADKSVDQEIKTKTGKGDLPVENVKTAVVQIIDSIPEIKTNAIRKFVTTGQAMAPSPTLTRVKSSSGLRTRGRVLSSEDNMPVPGASITVKGTNIGVVTDTGGNFNITLPDSCRRTLVASFIGMKTKELEAKADSTVQVRLEPSSADLSEVVVTGYGVSRAESEKEAVPTGYDPPQPVKGSPYFDKYIQENIQRPDSATAGQRVVVVVSFLVHTDGRIDSIRIVRSPDKLFSDEAIRLIKSGPAWKPAKENGKAIEAKVRVRIIFK